MADPDEYADAWLSNKDHRHTVLILCPCGEQLEAESNWRLALTCHCGARYEFGIPPSMNVRPGESKRLRVRVWRRDDS